MKVLLKENNQVKWVEEVEAGDPILTKSDGFELVWDKSSDAKSRLIKEGTVVGWRNIKPPLGGIEFRYRIKKYGSIFGSWQTILLEPQNNPVYNAGNWGYVSPVKSLRLSYTSPQLYIGVIAFYTHQGASSSGDQIEILLPSMPAFGLDTGGGGWTEDFAGIGLTNVTFQVTSDNFNNPLYVIPYGMTLGSNGDFGGFDYIVKD